MLIFSKTSLKFTLTTFATVLTLGFLAIPAQAQTTYYVNGANGDDTTNSCTAPDSACQTISGALDKVVAGDTVKIAPWANPYDEKITIPVGDLTIEGTGQYADEVLVNQGFQSTADNITVRNLFLYSDTTYGVLNSGNLTLEKVIVTGHSEHCGGGISTLKAVRPRGFPQTDATTLILKDSTVTGSTSQDNGGGICARSKTTVVIINSVLSGNQAVGSGDPATADYTGMGGAVFIWGGSVFLFNSTVTGNQAANTGGGFHVLDGIGYNLELYNSLVAGNTAAGVAQNCDSNDNIQDGAYNLADDNSCDNPANVGIIAVHGNPLLDALLDNGGFTPTHALLEGSPAIDAGDPDGCKGYNGATLDVDQTGHQRVGRCDIGSFEFVPDGWVPPDPNSDPGSDPGSDPTSGDPTSGSTGNSSFPGNSTQDGGSDGSSPGSGGSAVNGPEAGGCSLSGSAAGATPIWLMGLVLLGIGFRRRK